MHAQPLGGTDGAPTPAAPVGVPLGPRDPDREPSAFVSTAVDIGYQYLRPRGSVGYGNPWGSWVGVDANPLVSGTAAGGYGGVRLALPPVNLRAGLRYLYSFRKSFLPIQEQYNRRDIEFSDGDPARYLAWETELTLSPIVGPGYILSESALTYMTGVPSDQYVYTEQLRIVAKAPWIFRQQLGYVFPIDEAGALKIGIVGEYLRDPDRETDTVRGGILLRMRIFQDLEARGNFVPVLFSPDELGIKGGDFGQLGIRWTWAEDL
ncbi:MAG: hypothetical protein KC492_41110 [Myxococcales bacterium]|nr:hypothetical protein [Myxococcales bacterium]MCB9607408.1 hypothetical protein [Polyangiaceae bacterium]